MNRPVLFILLSLFWVMLTWPAEGPRWEYLQELGTGVVAALAVTLVIGSTARVSAVRWLEPRRYFWAFTYLLVLTAYVVKANFEVAYFVIHPAMPIRPGIVRVKTGLRRSVSQTVLCNSITLTPGTLTVDIEENGEMLVHWINISSLDEAEATRRILGRFEWFVAKIFE